MNSNPMHPSVQQYLVDSLGTLGALIVHAGSSSVPNFFLPSTVSA